MTGPHREAGGATPPVTAHHFEVRTTSDSHFSWIRTRLSTERTLMSWVRTAASLIGFGFTIVQFFERFSQMQGVREAARPAVPRYLGLALIAAGVLALTVAIWQYRQLVRYLASKSFEPIAGVPEIRGHSPLFAVSVVLLLIGLVAFGTVLFRLL